MFGKLSPPKSPKPDLMNKKTLKAEILKGN